MSQNQKTKSQMLVSLGETKDSNTEKIWEESGFFKEQRIDLTIPKANFPENTLCYVNQGSASWGSNLLRVCYLRSNNGCCKS